MTTCPPILVAMLLVSIVTATAEELGKGVTASSHAPAKGLVLPRGMLIRSTGSGAWSSPNTWEAGKVPSAGSQVLIREGHRVVYDVASDDVIRSLHISGTLTFAHDKNTLLNVGLIRIQPNDIVSEEGFDCEHAPDDKKRETAAKDARQPGFSAICNCCQSKSALLVGTPERPIDSAHVAAIRLHYVDGMNAESCPAIVACGGRMDFHGAPLNRTWVNTGATARAGTRDVVLAESVTGWKPGDRVIVTASDHWGRADQKGAFDLSTEERTITAINGPRITVDEPLAKQHHGEGDYRAEIANLSRNVVLESANPNEVRGHTMYHVGSAGSISYAEFRHLGKQGVLGRYNLHYHLCGDTMRGSSIVGASFHHSHNRWLTVHGTNYLVVRDCVGYQSVGHGFFLEDGTEVFNVFDRNLACLAVEGRPLPKQLLPFDPNDGAGFWFANAHNTLTRNVAVQCRQYGYRYEATPKAGLIPTDGALKRDFTFGDGERPFDLVRNVRQPDGSRRPTDIRTLPFVRFEDNESHSHGFWGMNLGLGVDGVGPDAANPFVIRKLKIWAVVGGLGIESPNVLIDGMTIHEAGYGTRGSRFNAQDWRNVSINARGRTIATQEQYLEDPSDRHRQPGWPEGTGGGGATYQLPEIETAKLTPVDKLPPMTAITGARHRGNSLIVRGTTSDNDEVKAVKINGLQAHTIGDNYSEWEVVLSGAEAGAVEISAAATDAAGNTELTPHQMTIVVQSLESS